MQTQYRETYHYIYNLLDEKKITQLSDIESGDKYVIINMLMIESPEIDRMYIINGDEPMPYSLAMQMLDAGKDNAETIRKQAVNYFWRNALYILSEIFEEAERSYDSELGIEPSWLEHAAVDNRERAKAVNEVLSRF